MAAIGVTNGDETFPITYQVFTDSSYAGYHRAKVVKLAGAKN